MHVSALKEGGLASPVCQALKFLLGICKLYTLHLEDVLCIYAIFSCATALVVFVIVFPALCTAIYHYISYKKGWDFDEEEFINGLNLQDIDCGSECSECRKEFAEEGQVT